MIGEASKIAPHVLQLGLFTEYGAGTLARPG